VDIGEVVEEAVEDLRSQAEEKEQVLSTDVPEGLPPVWGDRDSLVRVTSNLLSNAHKFTPAGGRITVMAEAFEEEAQETVVHVAVRDTGIGIRPEELEKVFEKFYRSDDREATDLPGSGLGLSIASNLVEMQGGKIWLESVFREGTTVHFIVPTEQER
jgi:signal transduction histidine kinase